MDTARVAEQHTHHLSDIVLTDEVERWLRWIARILSVIVISAFAWALWRYEVPGSQYMAWEETASIIALAVAVAGLILAWVREGVGGSIAVIAGVFVGSLAAYQYSLLLALGVALLFLVPGLLFLLAWQRTQTWRAVIVLGVVSIVILLLGGGVALAAYQDGHGPTHPSSATVPLANDLVAWMWSGGVTDSSAAVVAKVPEATEVQLLYATDPIGLTEENSGVFAESKTRGPVYRFTLTSLEAGTHYYYALAVDGAVVSDRTQEFSTFPSGPTSFTVGFASCARTGSNGSVFDTIRALQPDLFMIMGDLHYGDVSENSLDAFAQLYDTQLGQPAPAALYGATPIAYTWDDHDYGPNDAAGDSPSRMAALSSYRLFVPHYDFALEGSDAPIAQAFTIGRVRFVLTDTRSARHPRAGGDSTTGTVLGEEQLAWFLEELKSASQTHEVIVWVSSIPWIADAEPGADHWGGYAEERETIAAFVADHNIDLLVLAGDAHMVAIDDGSHSGFAPGGSAAFPVMQAAALDRQGSFKGGPYSEGALPGGGQFGVLDVLDEGGATIHIELTGMDWQGMERLHYAFDVAARDGQE